MYHYWKSNKNVILTAVAMFIVSLTALLFFLTQNVSDSGADGHSNLKANIVDSIDPKSYQEAEEQYRGMLEYEEGAFVVLGVDGLINFSSGDFETITDYTMSEVQEELFYSFIHPDDLSVFLGAFGKTLASKSQVMMIGPYRMRNADGEYHLHMASLYPVEEDGEIVKIIISLKDITEEISTNTSDPENDEGYEDDTNGHGNNDGKCDKDNKGKDCNKAKKSSQGKKIRNEQDNKNNKLLVEKLAAILRNPIFPEHSGILRSLALKM